MVQHIVVEAVCCDWIIDVIILKGIPVIGKLFRAKHKNGFIPVLVILDDRKCGEGLAQAHAVGKDAAVVFFKFIDDSERCILLKVI